MGIASSAWSARLSRHVWERTILVTVQILQTGLNGATVFFYCVICSSGGGLCAAASDGGNSTSSISDGFGDSSVLSTESYVEIVMMYAFVSMQSAMSMAGAVGGRGVHVNLIGTQCPGLMQSYYLAFQAIGCTVGAQWVGIALEYFSDCDLWTVCYVNYALVWATFGPNFHRYHPAFITLVNGDHAVIGPSGFSTSSVNGPTPAEAAAVDAAFPDGLRARAPR
jgi:hypothetical protein